MLLTATGLKYYVNLGSEIPIFKWKELYGKRNDNTGQVSRVRVHSRLLEIAIESQSCLKAAGPIANYPHFNLTPYITYKLQIALKFY